MYVKLIEETLNIANMPDTEAIVKGYKPAIFTDKPIAAPGYHAASYWVEEDETYTQRWEIMEDEPFVPTADDKAEAYDIFVGVSE